MPGRDAVSREELRRSFFKCRMRRGQSKQSAEPDVQALLSFKALKDKQHPEALAIWARYQDSGNEGELNMGISKLLSSKAAAKPRAAAPLPPGGIDTFPDAGECLRSFSTRHGYISSRLLFCGVSYILLFYSRGSNFLVVALVIPCVSLAAPFICFH